MAHFICTEKCFHNGKLYYRGDPASFTKAEDGPKNAKTGKLTHFEEVDRLPVAGDGMEEMAAEMADLKAQLAEAMALIKPAEEGEGDPDPPNGNESDDELLCDVPGCERKFDSLQKLKSHRYHCLKRQEAAEAALNQ